MLMNFWTLLPRISGIFKKLIFGKRYLYDYVLAPKEEADGHDHAHVCFAARTLGTDIKNHCPYYGMRGFRLEEGLDEKYGGTTCECDECKYFGSVTSTKDGLRFFIDKDVVDLLDRHWSGNAKGE